MYATAIAELVVVNCAGFDAITPLIELTGDKWRSVQAAIDGGSLTRGYPALLSGLTKAS